MHLPKIDNTYSDIHDNPAELTKEELDWFYSIVTIFQQLPEAEGIRILNCNHELLPKRNREALGIFYRPNDDNTETECLITIDNYFIHEMYDVTFNGAYNIAFETLEGCIAHEIAHKFQFRHCKRHERITQEILEKYYRRAEKRGET